MITMIDEGVGRIMQTLNQLGIEDNTLVVFTSDHGDMMGEHGLFLKGFMHHRGTLQVPLHSSTRPATGLNVSIGHNAGSCPNTARPCGTREI